MLCEGSYHGKGQAGWGPARWPTELAAEEPTPDQPSNVLHASCCHLLCESPPGEQREGKDLRDFKANKRLHSVRLQLNINVWTHLSQGDVRNASPWATCGLVPVSFREEFIVMDFFLDHLRCFSVYSTNWSHDLMSPRLFYHVYSGNECINPLTFLFGTLEHCRWRNKCSAALIKLTDNRQACKWNFIDSCVMSPYYFSLFLHFLLMLISCCVSGKQRNKTDTL